jgi:hypothetical protein
LARTICSLEVGKWRHEGIDRKGISKRVIREGSFDNKEQCISSTFSTAFTPKYSTPTSTQV